MADILVIDDDERTCRIVARLLRTEGHDATCVHSAEEAIQVLDGAKALPELVLLDVMLPGQSGLALLRLLRAEKLHATMPVVIYSALSDEETRQEAVQSGADAYVVKGEGWARLYPVIERHLQ